MQLKVCSISEYTHIGYMTNKNIVPEKVKNPNKKIICGFLFQNGNLKLPYEKAFEKFFAIEEHKIIRPIAFPFYWKKIELGEIKKPEPIVEPKVVEPKVVDDKKLVDDKKIVDNKKVVASKPASPKPLTKAAIKAAVKKTTVIKAAKV